MEPVLHELIREFWTAQGSMTLSHTSKTLPGGNLTVLGVSIPVLIESLSLL